MSKKKRLQGYATGSSGTVHGEGNATTGAPKLHVAAKMGRFAANCGALCVFPGVVLCIRNCAWVLDSCDSSDCYGQRDRQ